MKKRRNECNNMKRVERKVHDAELKREKALQREMKYCEDGTVKREYRRECKERVRLEPSGKKRGAVNRDEDGRT